MEQKKPIDCTYGEWTVFDQVRNNLLTPLYNLFINTILSCSTNAASFRL